MANDFYKILGIEKTAATDEIKSAFKKLARKYHPDVNPGDKKAEEKFKQISEAYEVLSDPKKRKEYDTMGAFNFEGFPGGGGSNYQYTYSSGRNPFSGGPGGPGGFDINDLGEMFGDLFGGQAQKSRGRRGGFKPEPQKGKDLVFSVNIDFLEAAGGAEKNIRLSNGVSLKVKIPAGVDNGSRIRLAGKGEPGINGGEAGDLFIETRVNDHPFFKRQDDDITLLLPITVLEALKGAKIKVPTLDSAVSLTIPPSSQSGQKLRLKGKGMTNMKTKVTGDLYVILQITVPQHLDKKAIEKLEEIFANEEDPRKKFAK
ncbi:J domain-containing protein [bacterium]|nr:J domain-containing protein [bacterium]